MSNKASCKSAKRREIDSVRDVYTREPFLIGHAWAKPGQKWRTAIADSIVAGMSQVLTHPDPFVQTIVDVVVPRTVFGRVCLLGDAAFVVRPHTAGPTAKAARDATVLATALKRARQNVDAGLRSFEDTQLEYGRDLVGYGVALGQRWASKHARKPQPY
jgi:2-polyprenyl-6-methoxyphenol hydroxylase-like FAD-dependent oxidoreductase